MKIVTMYRARWQERVFLILSIAVAVTLPFSISLNSLAVILLTINWLLEGNWRNKWNRIARNKFALLFMGFYAYHVIGLLYSSNMHDGSGDLEKKLSFVIFPLIFATTSYLNSKARSILLNWFVASCFVAALVCLANGFYHLAQGDSKYMFYHELGSAIKIHAVYFSVYIGFSIFILLNDLKSNWREWTRPKKMLYLAAVVFFSIFLVLLSSKTILLVFVLMLAIYLALAVFQQGRFLQGAIISIACLTVFGLILFLLPYTRDRFAEVLKDKYDQVNPLYLEDYQYYHFTGGNLRLAIWKTLVEAVDREKAWIVGVGTGDTQDILTASYNQKHIYPGDDQYLGFTDYNAHNQFFQFLIALGGIGLFWFVVILVVLYMVYKRQHQPNGIALIILFSSFCLTESALCAQKGIVFFTFFSALLATRLLPDVESPEQK